VRVAGGGVKVLVGIDIGGTKTAVALGAPSRSSLGIAEGLSLIERSAFPTDTRAPWREHIRRIIDSIRALMARVGAQPSEILGMGVSCGGPLDSRAGLILSPPNLPGWDRVPITASLAAALGAPAFLQNDANACALAEWLYGAGRGCRNMVFLTFGTGMGAGLILDGRLYEGANDLAGEVGHVRLAEDGPEGYGKKGSFEGFCSGGGIANLAQAVVAEALARGERVSFCPDEAAIPSVTAQAVGEAAASGDPLAREILAASGRSLGRGLAMLIDVLNPERIVIGSIYVRCREFLQRTMEQEIRREALPLAAAVCTVVPAALGEQIGDYASLAVAARGLSGGTE
jgi:glucokinase